jgi:hypothetical protein
MPYSLVWVARESPGILERSSLEDLGQALQELGQSMAWTVVTERCKDLLSQALLQEREAEPPELYMLRGAIQTLEAILELPAEVRARMEELADGRG